MLKKFRSKLKVVIIVGLISVLAMSLMGCGEKTKQEAELKEDLLNNKRFWIADDFEVTDFAIIKRLTDEEQSKDTVYVSMKAGNEFYYETMAYTMYYTKYNEGWLLDSVEQYFGDDFEYKAVPLKAPLQTTIFDEIKTNSDISVRSFWEEWPILSVKDLYFFEDGKYTYSIKNETCDLEKGFYGCDLIVEREFELVTVHEVISITFWFESSNPHFFGWNLATAEISEITYEWNIEGVWKHPNDDYPVTVKLGGSSSEPTVEVEFTENDFFGTKHSGVVSNELGEVNSENIYKSACTVTDLWGFYDSEWFVITPNGVVDSEGKALWERIE